MKVSVKYCGEWNYLPEASRVKAEIRDAFGVETHLSAGSGGVFEVRLDGELIFNKAQRRRFPEPGEIVSIIRAGRKP